MARGLYGAPLLTKDLDVTLFSDHDGVRPIFSPSFRQVAPGAFVDVTGFGIDVFLASTHLDEEMLARARRLPYADTEAWVASPTDWAGLKLLEAKRTPLEAGRHLTDIVLLRRVEPIPLADLGALAARLGAEGPYRDLLRLLGSGPGP